MKWELLFAFLWASLIFHIYTVLPDLVKQIIENPNLSRKIGLKICKYVKRAMRLENRVSRFQTMSDTSSPVQSQKSQKKANRLKTGADPGFQKMGFK